MKKINEFKLLFNFFYLAFIYNKEYGVGDKLPKGKKISELDCLAVFKSRNYIKFHNQLNKILGKEPIIELIEFKH